MLRRSSSSSNIPLPRANLFGAKDSRSTKVGKRSQSVSRLSQRDSGSSASQLRLPRKSSLDRKSSTVGLLRVTPIHKAGARSGSLQRTTPSSAISQRTISSRCTTPTSVRKDQVTIQKLATDKKWVAEQYVKVQNFIMSSGLFELEVVNSTNIKPPSINNFIYITGILLMELFPRIQINKDNYKEVIPAHLKILRYPGTFASSVLKTVNTMHSWPQIIGMWSWLIDKVTLCLGLDDSLYIDNLEPEEKNKILLGQNVVDFLIKRYKIFNKNDSDSSEEIEKLNDMYIKNLTEYHEVDYEKFKRLQADVLEKKEYRSKQEKDIERLKSEKLKMETEIEQMMKEMEEFYENDPIEEKVLDDEIHSLTANLADLKEATECVKKNIADLQEAIKVQPCTYQEKLALLRQVDELEKENTLKRQKIEHAREIKNKFDHKLTTEIREVQSQATKWNFFLMEICIKKPHLKKLLLREKSFHDPEFLNELQQVCHIVDTEIVENLTKIEADLRLQEQKQLELEKEIKELKSAIYQTAEECSIVSAKVTDVTTEIEKMMEDLELKNKNLLQLTKELEESDTLETQAKTIRELESKKKHLEGEIKKFGPKSVSFFVEMHNQIVTNLNAMEKIKAQLIQKLEAKEMDAVEKQQKMLEILKSFKS